jgi:hypothetical protein
MIALGRDERGEGIVSALLLLAGALLPLCFLVALLGRVEQAALAAAQAASSAVRVAALAPDAQVAQDGAEAELEAAQAQTSAVLALRLEGSFARGGLLEADVSARLDVGDLPFVGGIGTITLVESARAPVDLYRALPGSS